MRLKIFSAGLFFFLVQIFVASAQETGCVKCHDQLMRGKVIHIVVRYRIGCSFCHSGIIASSVPHKRTNTREKGLIALQPDICYNCHDKGMFTKKDVHAALGMGCTGCHNPHSSDNPKLLVSGQPDICYNCHDKAGFSKKTIHSPVAAGMCLSCHTPHASDQMALLMKKPFLVCLDCHGDVLTKSHLNIDSTSARHPLGEPVKKPSGEKEFGNPAQKDKPFYCGSCHDPHSTDTPHLFMFNAQSPKDLCKNCHAK